MKRWWSDVHSMRVTARLSSWNIKRWETNSQRKIQNETERGRFWSFQHHGQRQNELLGRHSRAELKCFSTMERGIKGGPIIHTDSKPGLRFLKSSLFFTALSMHINSNGFGEWSRWKRLLTDLNEQKHVVEAQCFSDSGAMKLQSNKGEMLCNFLLVAYVNFL